PSEIADSTSVARGFIPRVLYLWVAGSSKVTRVGRCPLFVFRGHFYAICSTTGACPRGRGARSAELRTGGIRRPVTSRGGRSGSAVDNRSAGSGCADHRRGEPARRRRRGEAAAGRRLGRYC